MTLEGLALLGGTLPIATPTRMAHWFQPAAGRWAPPSSSHKLSAAQTHRPGTLTYSLSSGITTKTDPNHALPPLPLISVPGAVGGRAKKSLTEQSEEGLGEPGSCQSKDDHKE